MEKQSLTIIEIPYEQIRFRLRRCALDSALLRRHCGSGVSRQLQSPGPLAASRRSKLGAGAKRLSAAGGFDSESREYGLRRSKFREVHARRSDKCACKCWPRANTNRSKQSADGRSAT